MYILKFRQPRWRWTLLVAVSIDIRKGARLSNNNIQWVILDKLDNLLDQIRY
jgi:hypothetical protein